MIGKARQKYKVKLELGDSPNEGIVNMLLAAKGVRIAALITETEEGQAKCSLRSVGDYDVQSIARLFKGGGHKNASGLKITESYDTAVEKIRRAIREYLEAY